MTSKTAHRAKLAVVIAAAGSSRRFGLDKLAAPLGEATVLECSIEALRSALPTAPLVVVVHEDRVDHWRATLSSCEVIAGGPRRQDSVRLGVEKAAELGAENVAVHDGARPLVHPTDIVKVIDVLGDGAAAILAAEISETVKRIDNDGVIVETIDRDRLRLAQTPQVFQVAALKAAWRNLDPSHNFSDEASMIEAGGGEVRCVMSKYPNPKLTTSGDLDLVRLMTGKGP
jgi:2-C-methyl-D-erythritol 4-phosphate cytidylyltransferase